MTSRVRWSLMKQRLRRLVRDSGPYEHLCEHHRDVMTRLAAKGNHPHADLPEIAVDMAKSCRECLGLSVGVGLGRER